MAVDTDRAIIEPIARLDTRLGPAH
jgi:hypothetical protein